MASKKKKGKTKKRKKKKSQKKKRDDDIILASFLFPFFFLSFLTDLLFVFVCSFFFFFFRMVTPRFSLRQDDDFVMVDMRVPGHVKLGEDDVYMEGKAFMFHAHPYFLRFALLLPMHTHTQKQGSCGTRTRMHICT